MSDFIQQRTTQDAIRKPVLRLCEWGRVSTKGVLQPHQREAIAEASRTWKSAHRLPAFALQFHDLHGDRLTARQYVGVVEAGGTTIEIYSKLDAAFLEADTLSSGAEPSVLQNLLWLLEVTGDDHPRETDTAALTETDTPILEMFALLLARRLRSELPVEGGLVRYCEAVEVDLHAVRGRVILGRQITHYWNWMDTIACAWDEFSPNHALNQVLLCACSWLRERVHSARTRWLLTACLEMLECVDDISVAAALHAARRGKYRRLIGQRRDFA